MVKVANGNFSDQFVLQRLTSEVYGVENPPRDWADVGLLIPHECIRREMHHMLNGIDKLIRRIEQGRLKPWHVLYFCEWFIDVFEPFVISHHEAEERLYFPWIASKADFPQGKKKFAHGHTLLSSLMDGIGNLCENVIEKKGLDCNEEIRSLWKQMHIFVAEMNDHLMEEEQEIPPLVRANFSKDQERAVLNKIARQSSLPEMRDMYPAVLASMRQWSKPEFVEQVTDINLSASTKYLVKNYYIPDYDTSVRRKRDAPLLETRPVLSRKPCFGINGCFACIV